LQADSKHAAASAVIHKGVLRMTTSHP